MKEKQKLILIIIIAMITVIALAPMPVRVDMRFSGELDGEYTVLEVSGWELRYLFRKANTELEMSFTRPNAVSEPLTQGRLYGYEHPELGKIYSYVAFDGDNNAFIGGVAKVEGDFDAIVLSDVDSSGGEARFIRER